MRPAPRLRSWSEGPRQARARPAPGPHQARARPAPGPRQARTVFSEVARLQCDSLDLTGGAGQIARPHRSNKKRATVVVPRDNWNLFSLQSSPHGTTGFFSLQSSPHGTTGFFSWTSGGASAAGLRLLCRAGGAAGRLLCQASSMPGRRGREASMPELCFGTRACVAELTGNQNVVAAVEDGSGVVPHEILSRLGPWQQQSGYLRLLRLALRLVALRLVALRLVARLPLHAQVNGLARRLGLRGRSVRHGCAAIQPLHQAMLQFRRRVVFTHGLLAGVDEFFKDGHSLFRGRFPNAQACGCKIMTPRYACNLAPGCISSEPTFAGLRKNKKKRKQGVPKKGVPRKGVPEKKGKGVSFSKA